MHISVIRSDLSYKPRKGKLNNLIFKRLWGDVILNKPISLPAFNVRLCSNQGEKLKKYNNVSLDLNLFLAGGSLGGRQEQSDCTVLVAYASQTCWK